LRFGRERRTWLLLLATGIFLLVASLPVMRAFMTELRTGAVNGRASSPLATGIYNLYCLFVSESVAPWIWVPEIAAALAIAVVLLLVFVYAKPEARRFFVLRGAVDRDDLRPDCNYAAHADDQPMADPSYRDHARNDDTAISATFGRKLARFGRRDWMVRDFLAQTLRRAALDRALGSSGATGRGSCRQWRDRDRQQSFVLFLFDVFHTVYQPCDPRKFCGDFALVGARAQHLFAAGVDGSGRSHETCGCGFRWTELRSPGAFDGGESQCVECSLQVRRRTRPGARRRGEMEAGIPADDWAACLAVSSCDVWMRGPVMPSN
jgi:hypothetical protein